ncbi:DUF6882 domain-containing protein [Comamonas sp.]|uniref:DUF6882 domain-containing protein n=1 Tax=Comamonas sp. TaxID=34028 RepID=UPI0028A2885A|nr:DUF6882 domain-containing protein [Comamonas sp.]
MNDTTTSPDGGETDWAAWSREAVETMMARNTEWPRQFGLQNAPQYHWDLESASLVLQAPLHEVQGTVCLVGTSSEREGSFVWSWANANIPAQHGQALEVVHDFGREHQLALLTTASIPGGRPEATECLCIAARLQRAIGTFIDQQGDITLYFSILHLQVVQNPDQALQ